MDRELCEAIIKQIYSVICLPNNIQKICLKQWDIIQSQLEKKVLSTEKGKKYIFYEVDTSDQDMIDVLDLLNVDGYQTKHGPTVFIGAEGSGFWAHAT